MFKLSVITVCFNAASTIRNCIESVRNQGPGVEHIIVDGGSSDETLEILEHFRPHVTRLISEPDNGIYDAINKGLRLARGDVIGILHASDYYANSAVLQKVVECFENEKLDSCYGDLVYVDSTDTRKVTRYWRSGSYARRKFYNGWMPPHPTFFVRRSIYKKYGLFNLNLGSSADYELMLRFLLKKKISCGYIPEVLVHMRNGGISNASFKNRLAAHINDYFAWKINRLMPYPWTLMMKPLRKIGQFIARPHMDVYDSRITAKWKVEPETAAGLGVESGLIAGWKIESGTAADVGGQSGTAAGWKVESRTDTGVDVEAEPVLSETVRG